MTLRTLFQTCVAEQQDLRVDVQLTQLRAEQSDTRNTSQLIRRSTSVIVVGGQLWRLRVKGVCVCVYVCDVGTNLQRDEDHAPSCSGTCASEPRSIRTEKPRVLIVQANSTTQTR